MSEPLYLAKSADDFPALLPQMTNRHGLITGATGTGKTVTLQTLAERLSYIGVPVFMADVKGDLSGMGAAGTVSPKLQKRIDELGLEGYANYANTVAFWDVFGENGIPVRATISDMGPLLLARLLNLNDTQSGVLQMVFKIADDQGLLLLDLKDLRAMVQHVGDNAAQFKTEYGNVSTASIGAIQRGLLTLEEQGGDVFFGEPMLDINDLMQVDSNGRGVINVLAAEKLIHAPALYSTFLLWLLAELFEQLPEAGDLDKPKLVFFFDEAHLLFDGAPAALVDKVEQVVRLIRSKGVGVFFVTQNPLDVPEKILGQLGNRVQHALRAFTPRDQKAVKTAAETFPPNPHIDVVETITQLGVGEALVTTLQEGGVPLPVERTLIVPPHCRIGAITDEERATQRGRSPVGAKYDAPMNRDSAFEQLNRAQDQAAADAAKAPAGAPAAGDAEPTWGARFKEFLFGTKRRQGAIEQVAKSAMRTAGTRMTNQILRGILGGVSGGSRRRR